MRDKKMFISAILITTVMLFVGGCGMQAEPVSADMADTVKEADTEESLETTPSPTALPEESMESSEDPDNSENKAIVEDNTVAEDEVMEGEVAAEVTTSPKTESTKTESGKNESAETPAPVQSAQPAQTDKPVATPEITQSTHPTATPEPVHTHTWKEHTVTKEVWIPHIVVVDDYEERVVGHADSEFICDCGYMTTSRDDIANHVKSNVLAGNYEHGGFTIREGYDIVESVKVGSHEEDHGHNETQTYVDYYYCECGETKN